MEHKSSFFLSFFFIPHNLLERMYVEMFALFINEIRPSLYHIFFFHYEILISRCIPLFYLPLVVSAAVLARGHSLYDRKNETWLFVKMVPRPHSDH